MVISTRFALTGVLMIALGLGLSAPRSWAQDSRFQPPRPPPLDGEAFDDDEDVMELGDEGYRPPPPPPPMGNSGGPSNGAADFRPPPPGLTNLSGSTTSPKKFKFQVVEGEFYEKGKKRTRGAQTHVSGADAEK
jgi:hypothetical protein